MEKFVVKHYADEAHPSIKGNGFDGLVVGEYREEAEKFIEFVNNLMVRTAETAESCQIPTTSAHTKFCKRCVDFDREFGSDINKKYCPYCGAKLRIAE